MEEDEGVPFPKPKRWAGGFSAAVRRRLPILVWAREYTAGALVADVVAGVTLGLTLVPQSIAYASLADLPAHYGLYSSFAGTILYMFLGTVKEVSIGPTSLMALLTLQTCRGLPPESVVLLAFLSGAIVMLMGLLRLGALVDLISPSVTSGFTSGTAVIIIFAQLKGLLGLSFVAETLPENVANVLARWRQLRPADCALAAVCTTTLLLLRKLKDVPARSPGLRRALWLLSISRNALVVLGAAVLAYCTHGEQPLFLLSGRVAGGLPPLAPPPFSLTLPDGQRLSLSAIAARLGSALLMMPLVMVLSNITIAKAFSVGGRVRATQEMLALGACNMAGACLGAMPTCGAFTRSAVSAACRVRTQAASLHAGIVTLLALVFLSDYFYYIPRASLSSVLVCAVVFMIDISIIPRLWRESKSELAVLVITFAMCVSETVEVGVAGGVACSLLLALRRLLYPPLRLATLKTPYGEVVLCRPETSLLYINAERVAAQLQAASGARGEGGGGSDVLVDCATLSVLDHAAEQVVSRLFASMKSSNRRLVFYRATSADVRRALCRAGASETTLLATTAADALAISLAPDDTQTEKLLEQDSRV